MDDREEIYGQFIIIYKEHAGNFHVNYIDGNWHRPVGGLLIEKEFKFKLPHLTKYNAKLWTGIHRRIYFKSIEDTKRFIDDFMVPNMMSFKLAGLK